MEMAIEEMLRSRAEHKEKSDPLVGAVLISSRGDVLGCAHRGALRVGDHAEYTLIERLLPNTNLEGSSLFVTLEPCITRGPSKTPCAERIVQARIGNVIVGIPDPNPEILGRGIQYLLKNGVIVTFFDSDLIARITDANSEFIEYWDNIGQALPETADQFEGASTKEREVQDGVSLDCFSLDAIRQYLKVREIALEVPSEELWNFFEQCRYVGRTNQDKLAPTLAGVVLFGRQPSNILPQVRISLDATVGGRKVAVDFDQPLVEFRDALEEFTLREMRQITVVKGFDRISTPQFPLEALREGAFNAVAHRDYNAGARVHISISDEDVTIRSPGSPLIPLSIAKLREFNAPPYSRNPYIATALHHLGWIEEKGSGLPRMRDAMISAGLPAPDLRFEDGYVIVRLRDDRPPQSVVAAADILSRLTLTQQRIYKLALRRGKLTTGQCAKQLNIDASTARRALNSLVERNLLERVGKGPRVKYRPIQKS